MQFYHFIGNDKNSVQGSYSTRDLCTKTIIRDESTNIYYVFNNQSEFETWYMNQKTKHYHEIILGYQIQRLKFDIDICIDMLDVSKIILHILNTIINTINDIFYCIDDINLESNDFIITESSGSTIKGFKHSYHIILFTYAISNNIEAQYITDCVINKLPEEYKKYIDKTVNKSIQNFRILYSTKCNSDRIKVINTKFKTYNGTLLDTMIVPFNGIKVLSQLCDETTVNDPIEQIDDSLTKKIIQAVQGITDGHKYRNTKNNTISFDRLRPTFCTLCDEIHHRDNSLVLTYDCLTGNIYEFCRQSSKTKYICNINKKEKVLHVIKSNSQFDTIQDKIVYNEPTMREYELVPTLVIKAQMKVGKTKTLHKYVTKHFNNEHIIRFITFRQTFSNHVYTLFNDFELYSSIKGFISNSHKRIIIQVESLYRLQIDNNDLLILDEIESIFNQLSSGLHKNFNASLAMFIWLISTSKYVVCMDANLSDRTFNILKKFRKEPIFFHHNTWQSAKNDKYYITFDKKVWLSQLCSKLQKNKKIVLPTNSIMEAKTCEMLIKTMFPDKKIKLFSSELKHSEKQLYFNNVHKYWSELDILIYTPTCSAGVSYELEHFDILFGYFCNMSCDVETCRQMIYRVRNIKDLEYYICIKEIEVAKLPTTSEELHNYLYTKRTNMSQYIKDSNLQYSYDTDGQIKFYETDYYYIWLENMSIMNMSKNNFYDRFIHQVKDSGAKINKMELSDTILKEEYCDARKVVETKLHNDIASAIDLSAEDVELILNKIGTQADIELSEYQAYEKYKLRKCYNYSGIISPTFVEYYMGNKTQIIYRNLCDITFANTIQESIDIILKREHDRFYSVVNNQSKYKNKLECHDLHNDKLIYTSLTHILTSKLITTLGTKHWSIVNLIDILDKEIWPMFEKHSEYLSVELDINISGEKIATVNKLLKKVYGLRISKNKETVKLKKSNIGKLFTFSKELKNDTVTIITSNELFLDLE